MRQLPTQNTLPDIIKPMKHTLVLDLDQRLALLDSQTKNPPLIAHPPYHSLNRNRHSRNLSRILKRDQDHAGGTHSVVDSSVDLAFPVTLTAAISQLALGNLRRMKVAHSLTLKSQPVKRTKTKTMMVTMMTRNLSASVMLQQLRILGDEAVVAQNRLFHSALHPVGTVMVIVIHTTLATALK